ncbi:MAG: formylglycine-generating enzyme family protein, partial [Methylocella sp.]
FAIGKYEVTFDEYDEYFFDEYDVFLRNIDRNVGCREGHRPKHPDDGGWGRERQPVINVSWRDATCYAKWLTKKRGLDDKHQYRLPTEAEWEYAARAGTKTRYSWGDDPGKGNANCEGCGSQWDGKQTARVGSFKPNAFGLYDMHGNVWEWVEDVWHDNYKGAPADGSAWLQGGDTSRRVVRGGSWVNDPLNLRTAYRDRGSTGIRGYDLGFRVARTLTP